MSILDADLEERARTLIEYCSKTGQMIATAESCTGGLIAAALTEVSGSSAVVDRGFITYSNDAKMKMLGVRAETLEEFGAVSRETALQMASGALWRSNAYLSVAVTRSVLPSFSRRERTLKASQSGKNSG